MAISELHRLQKAITEGKRVAKEADVDKLVTAAVAENSPDAKAFMRDLLQRKGEFFDDVSYKKIADIAGVAPRRVAQTTAVARLVRGAEARAIGDDTVFLGKDGVMSASAEVTPYVRGYNQKSMEPLKKAHGSYAYPTSKVVSDLAGTGSSPGTRLDAAAKAFGRELAFTKKVAENEWYSNPRAPGWWGTCDAWAWSSLSRWVNDRVDGEGPADARGLWVGGEWLSRADLGNWMMALADTISVKENGVYFEEEPGAENILKLTLAFLDDNGGGLVGEMWNDKRMKKREVWNQPYTEARITSVSLEPRVAERLLQRASTDGVVGATNGKYVKVTGQYIKELGEHNESKVKPGLREGYQVETYFDETGNYVSRVVPDGTERQTWNIYAVTDGSGKVLKAYFADDPAIQDVGGLPTYLSDAPPDYFWKPTLDFIYDAMTGEKNPIIDNNHVGAEYRFFVDTVLAKGVSATTRTRFEAEALQRSAPATAEQAKHLAAAYPGVANAYSPQQWEQHFKPLGLEAKAFGASW